MKHYTILISSILLSFSFVLNGQDEVSVIDVQNKYSFACLAYNELIDSTTINHDVSFSAGNHTVIDYIETHFKYPEFAKDNCIEGTVVVRFTINADGKIINPKIIQSVHSIIDSEIIEFIKNMPDWNPQVTMGRKVASIVELPFILRLR